MPSLVWIKCVVHLGANTQLPQLIDELVKKTKPNKAEQKGNK